LDHRGARRSRDHHDRRADRPGSPVRGEIVARNVKAKTFKIREDEGGGTFKVKVNRQTVYQGISGFKAIRIGRTDLEVVAHRADGRWIAAKVETRGGSGGGGSDD
jgi:hypothetical protein